MTEISASILSVKEEVMQYIYNLEYAKIDYFHIDIMDGKFVEADTSKKMFEYMTNIKQVSNVPLDVHLMVEDVDKYIREVSDYTPNCITFHYEAENRDNIKDRINQIKESGIKVGISIRPETKIEEIYEFLPYIHMVLIMTVAPGKGGQEFMEEMLQKIKNLKIYLEENKLEIDIEVDGGINIQNAPKLIGAGANILVVRKEFN